MAASKQLLNNMNKLKEIHLKCFSEHFNDFRKRKLMVDISIICHGTKFPGHKMILSASSSYFESALQNTKEELNEMEINNLDVESMEEILDFIYTGRLTSDLIDLDWSRFSQLLCASNALGIHHLFKYCCQVAREKIDVDNFFDFWDLSEKLSDLSMLSVVFDFASRNLDSIKDREEFNDLDPSRMQSLLSQTDREILSEDQLLDALITWTKYDLDKRQDSFDDLFSSMKSGNFSSNYLGSVVDDPLIKSYDGIFSKLRLSLQDVQVTTPSGLDESIYNLPEMTPDTEAFLKNVCVHHYYVVNNVAFCRVFSVRDGWKEPSELPFLLASNAGIAHLGGYVYFAGGLDPGMKPTNRVLRYNPLSKIADFVHPLMKAVWDAGVGISWGKIYVVGGKFLQNGLAMITDFVQCYDPATCTWAEINTWHVYRAMASAIAINGNFYIAGGFEYVDGTPCQRIIQYVANSTQPAVIMLPEPVAEISNMTAVCMDKIYVLRNAVQKAFLVYDPATKGWYARSLPGGPDDVTQMWSLCNKDKQLPYILMRSTKGELWLLHPLAGQWVMLGKDCIFYHSNEARMVFTTD